LPHAVRGQEALEDGTLTEQGAGWQEFGAFLP
jgi:hypothetical protein